MTTRWNSPVKIAAGRRHRDALLGLLWAAIVLVGCGNGDGAAVGRKKGADDPVPVMTAPIVQGAIDSVREFSGTLEAGASVVVASKVGGLLKQVTVNIGDEVDTDQLLVRIDDAEFRQAVAKARADLLVAEANLQEAKSGLEISTKILTRTETLQQRGVASESQLDELRSEWVSLEAKQAVYAAMVARARATLKQAKIQLADATVKSGRSAAGMRRFVAERFVDQGAVVTPNTPLLRLVSLAPIKAAFYLPEIVYAAVQMGQEVEVVADAYKETPYQGKVTRISPVFDPRTRRAKVEVEIANGDFQLKPGMFIRVRVKVGASTDASIVPASAVVTQRDVEGVYVLPPGSNRVQWQPVSLGIRQGEQLEIRGAGLNGQVVVLGQQGLRDGTVVVATTNAAQK